jgi:hypothetical protein
MNNFTAYCGLQCDECPAFIATQKDDDRKREKVAAMWSKQFNMNLSAEHINCDGCKANTGRIFGHCRTCKIRACSSEKGFETCAQCDQYACEDLSAFLMFVPHAKTALEKIRNC